MRIDPAPNGRAHDHAQRLHHCDRRVQALDVGCREVAGEEPADGVRKADCARHSHEPNDKGHTVRRHRQHQRTPRAQSERDTRDENVALALGEDGTRLGDGFLSSSSARGCTPALPVVLASAARDCGSGRRMRLSQGRAKRMPTPRKLSTLRM